MINELNSVITEPIQKSAFDAPFSSIESLSSDLEKYKGFIEASGIGAWEYFPETDFLWCNEVYFSMLGIDSSAFDLTGKSNLKQIWVDLVHPDDRDSATVCFNEYLKSPCGTYESYFRMKHENGDWRWIWSRGKSLKKHECEAPTSIIGTHVDITVHKNAQEAIQRERILLRTLIDNLPDTIYVKDIEARKIIANRADVACIGLQCEADVLGKTDLDLFNNDIGRRGYEDDMLALTSGNSILNREEYFLDGSGSMRWLLTSKIPVRDETGQVSSLLGIGHDITLRKKSEDERNKLNQELNLQAKELEKQANDLKELNKQLEEQKEQELEKAIAQGKFEIASEVLHDIGNAMVGIGSYLGRISKGNERSNHENIKSLVQFLKLQQNAFGEVIGAPKAAALVALTEGIAKTQTENQEETRASITELLHIISHIQEILNIQRQLVRGHNVVHERKPVNLVNLLDDCRSMLIASFDKRGIDFKAKIEPGKYIIKGDHTKLMQVFLNVLKNSAEAISLEADEKFISIDMRNTGTTIELTIVDNGSGFDEETASHMFTRGFSTKQSGTGLGLYNCRSIIESHSGTYEIESKGLGSGATTKIVLPLVA